MKRSKALRATASLLVERSRALHSQGQKPGVGRCFMLIHVEGSRKAHGRTLIAKSDAVSAASNPGIKSRSTVDTLNASSSARESR